MDRIGKTVRLTAQGNACIDGMPVISRSVLAAVVVRQYAIRIEDRHADVMTVIPVADVLHARAQLQGQTLGCFPVIRHEKRGCLVGGIGNGRRIVFAVAIQNPMVKLATGLFDDPSVVPVIDIRILTRANGERFPSW